MLRFADEHGIVAALRSACVGMPPTGGDLWVQPTGAVIVARTKEQARDDSWAYLSGYDFAADGDVPDYLPGHA